jgi:hypothetical protein
VSTLTPRQPRPSLHSINPRPRGACASSTINGALTRTSRAASRFPIQQHPNLGLCFWSQDFNTTQPQMD